MGFADVAAKPRAKPSLIFSAAQRMDVTGVRSSWETEATKSICCLAKCISFDILFFWIAQMEVPANSKANPKAPISLAAPFGKFNRTTAI